MEKHINLSDFFKGDALTRIRTYIKSLQNYIDEYDLIVLMARKAICFFEALVRNEEVNISNSKCRITTNRIFTYNITQFDGEKILLMDDIVVKGRTIRNTIKEAEKFNKNFKIYFLANKKNNNADMVYDDKVTVKMKFNCDYFKGGSEFDIENAIAVNELPAGFFPSEFVQGKEQPNRAQ